MANARRLAVTRVTSQDWSLLTGLLSGAQALLLLLALGGWGEKAPLEGIGLRTWAVAAGVAVLASVVGGALWNQASRSLPLALSGQVLVIETLAALLLGFAWEGRWPYSAEWAAMALLLVGVLWCLRCHQRRPRATASLPQ